MTNLVEMSAITEKHNAIGADFIEKVRDLLGPGLILKTYAADDNNWSGAQERALFEVKDKFRLAIELTTLK